MSILKVENLGHSYGKYMVIQDISLTVEQGELTALIGPNGAGKTTFYNAVTGKFRPSRGRIFFNDRDVTGMPSHKLVPLGLARSFQITNIFPNLTVLENVVVPLVLHRRREYRFWRPLRKEKAVYERAGAVLEKMGLSDKAHLPASQLAYGDKRLVEMAIVLAREPRLVMLDEPTAGMNPEETDRMIRLIKELSERFGTTLFLTEHDMKVVFSIASRIFVLHQGGLLAEGGPDEIRGNPKVKEAYLGGSVDDLRR